MFYKQKIHKKLKLLFVVLMLLFVVLKLLDVALMLLFVVFKLLDVAIYPF